MSAKFGQSRKIDVMKSTVAASVQRMDAGDAVTVWAFGVNPAKKCEDRAALISPEAVTLAAAEIEKSLSTVEPKAARAPVFDTLRAALDSFGDPKDAPATAVIIAGTGDDCTGDICGEAKRLHGIYPNTKLTVLGLGASEQAAANYTCAAKSMGGVFSPAKTGTELDKLLRQTLDIAPGAKPVQVQTPPAASTQAKAGKAPAEAAETPPAETPGDSQADAKPAQPPSVPAEPNLIMSAVLAEGSPILESGVTWEVYKINVTPTGQLRTAETPAWTGGGGQAKVKLPEGRYAVAVRYGLANASDEIAIGPGTVEKTVSLNAGTIAAESYQAKGAAPAEDVFYSVRRPKNGNNPEIEGKASESPALFHVNAGDYVLTAAAGLAKLDASVKVAAGKVSAVSLVLNTGIVQIDALSAAVAADARHELYSAAAKPGDAPLMHLSGVPLRIQLAAGNYRLETVYGNARISTPLVIVPGQTVQLHLAIDAGSAVIKVPAGKPAHICAVFEHGETHESGPVARGAGTDINFILKAGTYDLECRAINGAPSVKSKELSVVAGASKEVVTED